MRGLRPLEAARGERGRGEGGKGGECLLSTVTFNAGFALTSTLIIAVFYPACPLRHLPNSAMRRPPTLINICVLAFFWFPHSLPYHHHVRTHNITTTAATITMHTTATIQPLPLPQALIDSTGPAFAAAAGSGSGPALASAAGSTAAAEEPGAKRHKSKL